MSDTYTIDGKKVWFDEETKTGREFLTRRDNYYTAKRYLDEAREFGKAYFYAESYRYVIEYNKEKDEYGVYYSKVS